MFQFHLIRFDGNYLTSTGLVGGDRYISEIDGLGKLKLDQQSTPIIAIDGTVYEQYNANKGLPLMLKFELLDAAAYATIISSIRSSRVSGNTINLYISGSAGIFDLNVRCIDIEFPATALSAGMKNVMFNFIVADVHTFLTTLPATLVFTPAAATFTIT